MATNSVTRDLSWTNRDYSHCTLSITVEMVPVFVPSQSCDERNKTKTESRKNSYANIGDNHMKSQGPWARWKEESL